MEILKYTAPILNETLTDGETIPDFEYNSLF